MDRALAEERVPYFDPAENPELDAKDADEHLEATECTGAIFQPTLKKRLTTTQPGFEAKCDSMGKLHVAITDPSLSATLYKQRIGKLEKAAKVRRKAHLIAHNEAAAGQTSSVR